ncbi:hypothetical protein [Corynebacterium caspium]|uniref:hypothetical protein n=1 Tax=Corynebacterium caspium TaxID=234828 RepID=UPI00037D1FDE|nr:hypothetical protein [Corynebacterium caspium]WKD58543.1 hypothetical protein CCASP_00570 [Corynebacterium caspium DSM 44850]
MSVSTYPLPAFTQGGGTKVPLIGGATTMLFSLIDTPTLSLSVLPDNSTGGFLVRHGRTRIGRLPQDFREHYPQLEYLAQQGFSPEVTATVSMEENSGIKAILHFPAPGIIIPQNFPPTKPWALLPAGPLRTVDTSSGDSTALPVGASPSQWLATASVLNETVVLSLNDRVVGPLTAADSAAIIEVIKHYEALGLIPIARLFVLAEAVLVALAPVAELSEEALEPQINPLPAIEPYDLHTGQFPVVDAATGTWVVTMGADTAADPLPADPEGNLRPVTSPAMLAMTPTGKPVLVEMAEAAEAAAATDAVVDAAVVDAADAAEPAEPAAVPLLGGNPHTPQPFYSGLRQTEKENGSRHLIWLIPLVLLILVAVALYWYLGQ